MAKVAGCQRDNTLSKKEKQSTEVFGAVPSKLMPKHPVASLLSCCLRRAVSSAVSMILSSAQFHVLSTFYGQKYLSQTKLPGILHPPLNSGISGFGVGWAELLCWSPPVAADTAAPLSTCDLWRQNEQHLCCETPSGPNSAACCLNCT